MSAPHHLHWILHVCEYECASAGVCADACAFVCGCVCAPICEGAAGVREAQTVGGGPAAPSAHGPEQYIQSRTSAGLRRCGLGQQRAGPPQRG